MRSTLRTKIVQQTLKQMQLGMANGRMPDLQHLLLNGFAGLDSVADDQLQRACDEILASCNLTTAIEPCGSIAPDRYLVRWEIDIEEAESPRDAALRAHACQQRVGTTATVFSVTDRHTGETHVVDLDDGDAIDLDLPGLSGARSRTAARAS